MVTSSRFFAVRNEIEFLSLFKDAIINLSSFLRSNGNLTRMQNLVLADDGRAQGCQIFLGTTYQNGKKISNM
jgi:hypothetical protein